MNNAPRILLLVLSVVLLGTSNSSSHPMPHSVLLLDVHESSIEAELQLPLKEFQIVFPGEDIDLHPTTLIARKGDWLDAYLLQHLSIVDSSGRQWTITVAGKSVKEDEQDYTGKYHELVYRLRLQPPPGASPRRFVMKYDAIMHQLVTHKLFIKINHDWYGGLTAKDSMDADLGVLGVNTGDGTIPPVIVTLDEGSAWNGFTTMVSLGIEHIAGGTDHLLFLLVILLPAPLITDRTRWTAFGGTRYSIARLVRIVTAFTVGHSVSLLLGSMRWLTLPTQPVEIAIALTILITAIHAIRPLFFGKEIVVTAAFGLVHGLAFSTVLSNMNLDGKGMVLSILGFNIGIELMQLFVIVCTVPWLIVLCRNMWYTGLRLTGAVLAIAASLGWLIERITERSNIISNTVGQIATQGKWVVLGIACLAIMSSVVGRSRKS